MRIGRARPSSARCGRPVGTDDFRFRMRSQVQVLAGPPPIIAGQSTAGSEPGTLAASLGRAGAARPSPPASPSAPPGSSTQAAGATTTTHRGRPHPEDGNLALRPPPMPTAAPPATGAPQAGLACPGGQRQARPPPPPDPAQVRHRQPRRPCVTAAASPTSGPARPSTRAARRRGSPPGPGLVPVVRVPCRIGLCPTATAETRRTRPDGRGRTPEGWTLDGWTPDGRTPAPGR
jgi:hypothetical protein